MSMIHHSVEDRLGLRAQVEPRCRAFAPVSVPLRYGIILAKDWSMRIGTTLVAGVLVLAVPAGVSATDDGDRSSSRARVMGNSGLGSPVGLIGVTLTYLPRPQFQVELGTGLGFSGFQFSIMPKFSVGDEHHRFVLGVGPSAGITPNPAAGCPCVAYWLNAEAGYEFRSVGGFSFLIAVGVLKGLAGKMPAVFNGDPFEQEPEGSTPASPEAVSGYPILPEARIAFGRWL